MFLQSEGNVVGSVSNWEIVVSGSMMGETLSGVGEGFAVVSTGSDTDSVSGILVVVGDSTEGEGLLRFALRSGASPSLP